MFCDQDDIWLEDKVQLSLKKIDECEYKYSKTPLLVHTDLSVVDDDLAVINSSFWQYEYIDPSKNSLNRLLVQNTVTGCTVIINRELAKKVLDIPEGAIMHDWWMALVASEFGKIGYINTATMMYRQHQQNVIGTNDYIRVSVWYKIMKLLSRQNDSYTQHLKERFTQASSFLKHFDNNLDKNTKDMIRAYISLESFSFIKKRYIIFKYKFFKHRFIQNISMLIRI
jgi:hypothetical protein